MSIDLNWPLLSLPPTGPLLAAQVRAFIHARFQSAPLPRFIRSVAVQGFEWGEAAPELEILDVVDVWEEFYQDDREEGGSEGEGGDGPEGGLRGAGDADVDADVESSGDGLGEQSARAPTRPPPFAPPSASMPFPPFLPTPGGVPGGTSNLGGYFSHQPLASLSGTQTPLAVVAGGSNRSGWGEFGHGHGHGHGQGYGFPEGDRKTEAREAGGMLRGGSSNSPVRPSTATTATTQSSPPSSPAPGLAPTQPPNLTNILPKHPFSPSSPAPQPARPTPSPTDLQLITHIKYTGDIRLSLTAEILLDYPMPSFASIPVALAVTGVVFDAVGVLAWCGSNPESQGGSGRESGSEVESESDSGEGEGVGKVCFCFLGDGERAAVLGEDLNDGEGRGTGGILREVRVESEIGERGTGKTVLKNVGKVERFVLERVRGMIEEELVFPSFWTFLV